MHGRYIDRVFAGNPRATRWSVRVHVRYGDLFTIFEKAKTSVLKLEVEDEEEDEDYYRSYCKHMGVAHESKKSIVEELADVKQLAVESNNLSKSTHEMVAVLVKDKESRGTDRLEDFFDGSMMKTPIHDGGSHHTEGGRDVVR